MQREPRRRFRWLSTVCDERSDNRDTATLCMHSFFSAQLIEKADNSSLPSMPNRDKAIENAVLGGDNGATYARGGEGRKQTARLPEYFVRGWGKAGGTPGVRLGRHKAPWCATAGLSNVKGLKGPFAQGPQVPWDGNSAGPRLGVGVGSPSRCLVLSVPIRADPARKPGSHIHDTSFRVSLPPPLRIPRSPFLLGS